MVHNGRGDDTGTTGGEDEVVTVTCSREQSQSQMHSRAAPGEASTGSERVSTYSYSRDRRPVSLKPPVKAQTRLTTETEGEGKNTRCAIPLLTKLENRNGRVQEKHN